MKIVDLFWEGISIIKQAISWYKGSGKIVGTIFDNVGFVTYPF